MKTINECRCAANTSPKKLGSAIARNIEQGNGIAIACVGAGSVNQCVKAQIIANSFLSQIGKKCQMEPSFQTFDQDGKSSTKIIIKVTEVK